jgi:uncharacterized membrane protein YccC
MTEPEGAGILSQQERDVAGLYALYRDLRQSLDTHAKDTARAFGEMHAELRQHSAMLEEHGKQLGEIRQRLDGLDQRLDGMDGRIDLRFTEMQEMLAEIVRRLDSR